MLYQQIFLFALLMIAVTAQVGSNWRREQLDMVNNLRRQQGVRQLNYHHRLELAAQRHVDDLSSAGVPASHTGTDGSNEGDRATRAGYRWSRIGENAARGQRHVEGVFRSYMNSPTHYRNMIGQHWVDIGFGFNSNGNYWCQVFGTPRANRMLGMDDEYSEEDFVFVTGRMDEMDEDMMMESAGEAAWSRVCADGSNPVCADGSEPRWGRRCQDGSRPVCADGSLPTRPDRPDREPRVCDDNSLPVCADGSESRWGRCEDGRRPMCANGSRPSRPTAGVDIDEWLHGSDGTAVGEAYSEEGDDYDADARWFLPKCQSPSFTQSTQCSQVPMMGYAACTVYNLFNTCNLCAQCY